MADKKDHKKSQLSLTEYNKVKEERIKDKLKLHFPLLIKLFLGLPLGYFAFLLTYYLMHIRFTAEH